MDDIFKNYYASILRRENENFEKQPQQIHPILEMICASSVFNEEMKVGKNLVHVNPMAPTYFCLFQKIKLEKIRAVLRDRREHINVVGGENEDTCLHYAVSRDDRDIDVIRELLKHGANANIMNKYFETPLHIIARVGGASDIMQILLEYGGDPNVQNLSGDTPLHIATRDSENVDTVKVLLEYGAKVEIINIIYRNALHTAVEGKHSDLNLVKKLLEKQPMLINSQELKCATPLHFALNECRNNISVIKEFLECGANVTAKDIVGRTPLHFLRDYYSDNDFDVINALVARGADIDAVDMLQRTPLYNAVQQWSLDTVKLLLMHGAQIDNANVYGKYILNEAVNGFELGKVVKSFNEEELETFKIDFFKTFANLKVFSPIRNSVYRHSTLIQLLSLKSWGMVKIHSNQQMKIIKLLLEYGGDPDYGNLEYRLLPFDRQKPCADKLLIQYRVLKNFVRALQNINASDLIATVQSMTSFDIKIFEDSFLNDWLNYRNECILEIQKMRTEKISEHCSLFQFVSERCSTPEVSSNTSLSVVDNVLLKLNSNDYPCCRDIMYAAIKYDDIVNRLLHMSVYTRVNSSKSNCCKVLVLNRHVILYLISYLSKDDLINLTLAYLLESAPIKHNSTCSNKRKVESLRDNFMSTKCLKSA